MAAAKKKAKGRAAQKRAKAPRAPAEPKHEPTAQTRAIVERLALTQKLTHDEIGATIGISDVTLRKYYAHELATAKGRTTAAVMNSYLENCIGSKGRAAKVDGQGNVIEHAIPPRPGDVNAQKFYLERFAGMTPKSEVEHKVQVSGPNLAGLSDDELDQLEALHARMAGDAGRAN